MSIRIGWVNYRIFVFKFRVGQKLLFYMKMTIISK